MRKTCGSKAVPELSQDLARCVLFTDLNYSDMINVILSNVYLVLVEGLYQCSDQITSSGKFR
jgi:hypothetical protein